MPGIASLSVPLLWVTLASAPASVSTVPAAPPAQPAAPTGTVEATVQASTKATLSGSKTSKAPKTKVQPVAIRLKTDDKCELSANYFPPQRAKGKVPGVMLIHDQGAKAEDLIALADYLANKGLGVLLMDLRGHGASQDERFDWKKADEKQRKAMWALASKDLEAGAGFLAKRKELHRSKLVVVGHGKGCSLAVPHAIKNRNTLSTVLIQPDAKVYDFELTKEVPQLDGLPTLLLCSKKQKKAMAQVREAAAPQGEEDSTFEVSYLTAKPKEVLADKRLPKSLYGWLKGNL